ncbi:hypothetical protein TNCV_1421791 [Trichonephila clavipes]|nr:hypothetical protein TNCV_1421791 [Trichonephila clavipes]
MRTWQNLGGRAKVASDLVTKLVANLANSVTILANLVTILVSLATMLVTSEPSGIFYKVVNISTNVTSGYNSRSFYRAYKKMLTDAAMSHISTSEE